MKKETFKCEEKFEHWVDVATSKYGYIRKSSATDYNRKAVNTAIVNNTSVNMNLDTGVALLETTSGIFDFGADLMTDVMPIKIVELERPNNIGSGVWNQYVKQEVTIAQSTGKGLSKTSKVIGGVAVAVDVGSGIYNNIQENETTEVIVTDAVTDTVFSLGGLAASALGSAGASALYSSPTGPVASAIVSAVGGIVGAGVYTVTTELPILNGNSIHGLVKDGLNRWVGGN